MSATAAYPAQPTTGDIFEYSYGCDDLRLVFFEIVRSNGGFAVFREIESEIRFDTENGERYRIPRPGQYRGEEMRRKVKDMGIPGKPHFMAKIASGQYIYPHTSREEPAADNPGALCVNCKWCFVPCIDGFFSGEQRTCRAPDNVKISGIGHADTCPTYER